MTTDVSKIFHFDLAPHSELPAGSINRACDEDLEAVQDEIEALERGNLSDFDPSKLSPLLLHLEGAIQQVRNKEIKLDTLNGCFLDLIAIEEAVESYLTVAKKVIESNGKREQAREIQKFIKWAAKVPALKDFESPGIFWELTDAVRHPLKTLFPSLEQQKDLVREKFFNKARSLHAFLKGFQIKPKADPSKKLALQREAARIRADDLNAEVGMSEPRKRFWNGVFSSLQIGSQAIQFFGREPWDTVLKKEIARHAKPPLSKAQQREVAFVGKAVGEKLQALRSMSEEQFIRFTQRYPKARPFLDEYRKSSAPIKSEEISLIMEEYRASQMSTPPFIDLAGAFRSATPLEKAPSEPVKVEETSLGKWLETPPLQVDERLLAHVLGDSFAEGSGLEGYVSDEMRGFVTGALEQRKSLANDPAPYDEILAQFRVAAKFNAALGRRPEDLVQLFQKELSSLEKEGSFFFQAGWTGRGSGHSIVLEVRRQENNLFSFRVYNSGQGLKYHEKAVFKDQEHHLRFFEIQDIHSDRIASLPFCKALCMMNNEAPYGEWKGVEVYEALGLHLGGKAVAQGPILENMSKTISVGFCSYLSLAHWMQQFAPNMFDRFLIELQTKTFSDVAKGIDLHLERNLKLIRKSGQQLAINSQSAFEKGIISREEWQCIQQQIGRAIVQEPTVRFSSSLESVSFQTEVSLPSLKTLSEKENVKGKSLDLLSLEEATFHPETFLSETSSWRARFAKGNENQNYEIVSEAILEWIEKIPFQRKEELIATLKPEEALSLLHQLSEISKDYIFSGLMMRKGQGQGSKPSSVLPRAALASIKLLTLGHALSSAFEGKGGLLLPNLYQKEMSLILEGKSGSNHLFNPRLEEDLRLLRDYWREAEPLETRSGKLSFFGFEYLPASTTLYGGTREIFETEEEQQRSPCQDGWATVAWPDLEWMKEYIQKPEIQQQIALDPDLASKPLIAQAHILLHDADEDRSKLGLQRPPILPQAFTDLFELSFCVDFVMGTPVLARRDEAMPQRELGIQTRSSSVLWDRDGRPYRMWGTSRNLFGEQCYSTLPNIFISHTDPHGSAYYFELDYALALTQDGFSPDKEPLYRKQDYIHRLQLRGGWSRSNFRHRLPPSVRVLEFPGSDVDRLKNPSRTSLALQMPLQPMREKLALSADPALQIRETVAYYQKNPQLLETREDQILFKKLFFEPPLLLDFFLTHPQETKKFISHFEEFCQNGVGSYTELGSPMVAAFYLEITDKFQRFLSYISQEHPQLISHTPSKICPAEQLRSLIDRKIHAPEDEVFLYLDLILMQTPDALNVKRAVDLLEATMRLQTLIWPEREKQGTIREGYNTKEDSYLNPDYPHEKEALAKTHLLHLRVPLERLLKGPHRDEILNTVVQRMNPSFQPVQWEESPQFPYFTSSDGSIYFDLLHGHLYQKGGQIKTLPRIIREHSELRAFLDPTQAVLGFEIEPNTFEFSSKNGEKMRVFLEPHDHLIIQKEIEGRFAQKIAPFSSLPDSLKEKGDHWISLDSPHILWIGDNIRASLKGSEIREVRRIDTGWKFGDPKTPSSSPLLRIEDSNYVLPWTDPENGKMKQIELPKLLLTFDIGAEGNASSPLFDGYRIANEQYVPVLGNLNNYLTLENGNKKLVLIPAYPRKVETGKGLQTDAPFDKKKSAPLLAFELDAKGQLLPKSPTAHLYLAYLFLTEQRYEEAWNRLVGTDSELRPLQAMEREILIWLSSTDKIVQDPDPRAIALRLKAELLLLRDQEHFFSEEPKEFSDSHYADLLQKWDQVPPRFLPTPEEEARLSRFFRQSVLPQIRSRTKQFEPYSFSRLKEAREADARAIRLLADPMKATELFKCDTRNQNDEASRSSFLRAKNWDQNFISRAYGGMQNPTKESLSWLYLEFFPGKEVPSEDEMKQEIRDSLKMVARSESHPPERAIAALLLGVMKHPSAFPPASKLSEVLQDEAARRSGYCGGYRSCIPLQLWFAEHLAAPLAKYALPYVKRPLYPPYQFLPSPEKESPTSLWNAQSTRLTSSLTVPDVSLESLFSASSLSPYVAAHQSLIETFSAEETMLEQLKEFARSSKASPKRHSFKEADLLHKLEENVRNSSFVAKEREEELTIDLLKAANRLDADAVSQLTQIGGYLSDHQKPIEMPELLKLFLTLDAEALHEKNPALSIDECHALYRKTQEFLIVATQRQHLERLVRKCSAVRKAEGADRERLIEELALEGGQRRAYSPEKHPDFLLIEYGNNIRLRKMQVEAIENLTPGTAQEMIMGSGKTMVLLPLLALKAANGENLSMIVMPHELLPSMAESLETTLGGAFGKSIDVLSFNRDTHLDTNRLERIYERLQKAIVKRRVIAMSGSGLQSLFLMAVDSFHKNSPEAPIYRKILTLMKQRGNLILDEMHLLLDVLQAHHFSDGEKVPLSTAEMDGAMRLFHILSSKGWEGSKPIARTDYEANWKESLVDQVLEAEEFSPFSKAALKSYILEESGGQAAIYVDRIASREVQNTLATLKEQINRMLPLVLSKQIDEHFGEVPAGASHKGESKRVSIPYHGSQNPVLGSQFGSDLETIDYTTLLHLVKGVDTEIVQRELNQIKESILREMDELRTKDIHQAPSYQRFIELAGSDRYPLFTLQPKEIEEIRQKINQSSMLKLQLIRSWILPELRTYPRQLFTNGHIFPLLVAAIRGFSGTNWNSKTFPKAFERQFQSDTQSYTLHLLQSKEAPLLLPKGSDALLTGIADQSLADRGGIFRQMKNREVALRMLQNSLNARGVVYYEGDDLKVLTRNQAEPIAYSACPFPKEELLALWDQKHTTGSDIPLGAAATAIVTIGRHTHLFELLQSVWRLRGLHQGQKVQFAIPEEEGIFIADALYRETGRSKDLPLETRDLFNYCWLKERSRGKEHSARALGFKFTNELIAPVLDQIFDETESLPKPEILEELFYIEKAKDPYERYGRIAHSLPKEQSVENQVKRVLSSKVLQGVTSDAQAQIRQNIKAIATTELPHLPDQISSFTSNYETEVEIETQTEQEQEKEVEKEIEIQVEKDLFEKDRKFASRGIVSWEGPLSHADFLVSPAQTLANLNLTRADAYSLARFRDSGNLTPVVSVKEALQKLELSIPFDSDLTASATFLPLQNEGAEVYPFTPFGKHQDIVQEALLIQDVETGQIRMMLVNQDEARQFEQRLSKERHLLENGVRLALYHLDYGLYAEGADFPSEATLHSISHFMRLKAQAKFFNGDVHYSKYELRALETWISELQIQGTLATVKKLFEERILEWKEKSASDYPRSSLFKLFKRYIYPT